MELKRVVVTGMGVLTPIGNNLKTYTENLVKGVSGAAEITHFDASKFKTQFACELKNFNVSDYFDRKEARKYDPYSQYAIIAADEAIADSQLDWAKTNLKRCGVILGVGMGGIETFTNGVVDFAKGDGTPKFNPFFIPKMIGNIAGGLISIKHGLKGPNFTTTSACTSSANAIVDAFNYIRLGKADVIISGGAEAAVNEASVGGFNSLKAISTRNDDPKTASRPFDADRDGFVIGEGAGILVLEEYEHAKARGAKIYAELAGAGINADAYHMTAPHPDGEGATDVMLLAVEDAGLQTEDIDYINVHGTSTGLGDIAEPRAIQQAFGEHAYELNISSTKSMTGHLLGAAGAIEAIAAIFAVKEDIIPPTINFFNLDAELDSKLNFTFNKAQKRVVNAALSNTFGFGGHNASIVFKKYKA